MAEVPAWLVQVGAAAITAALSGGAISGLAEWRRSKRDESSSLLKDQREMMEELRAELIRRKGVYEEEIKTLQEKNKSLNADLSELEKRMDGMRITLAKYAFDLAKLRERLAMLGLDEGELQSGDSGNSRR